MQEWADRAKVAEAKLAQPPAPSEAAREYMTGYSDCKEWAGATSQALVVELVAAANKDAVLQASIDFIRELTGMEPPPIEVAPPETFQPFKTFADKVCAIFATPQAAAQPEPYGYHSPKTGKVYASTEAASMAMAGEVKTVYLAQPEPRPTEDALWDETLKDRDAYHQFADDLAAQIAAITGVDIGEHSSVNNPWQEALLAADDFIATQLKTMLLQQTQPSQAMRRDAARYRWLRSTTNWACDSSNERIDVRNSPELWDAAIDAAINVKESK